MILVSIIKLCWEPGPHTAVVIVEKFDELSGKIEDEKVHSNPPKDRGKYAGSYVGAGGVHLIDIVVVDGSFETQLQGRMSRAFRL